MKSDVEIAQTAKMLKINELAACLDIREDELEPYGHYKGKISLDVLRRLNDKEDGKLVLVTAISPTAAGEGKTTTTVGLADALQQSGVKTLVALREPSLGPCFGVKGGAAGGGYAQIVPMEDINLHFTGDIHAVSTAHNLLAALIDNHIQQGNSLQIDPRRITWRRVVDLNDRALRNIVIGLGGKAHGVPRETGFDISVASELMAILCLADSLADLKQRISRIIVGYSYDDKPVTVGMLKATGALATLFKDAIKPNLVQTLENTPAFVHGGPFANIAHGCNSLIATKMALKLADVVVTEAGFGADLGAEKFFDIKCRYGKLRPAAVVVVATIRALKMHGGVAKNNLAKENVAALQAGIDNLLKHCENIGKFGLSPIVAINQFPADSDGEIAALLEICRLNNLKVVLSQVWAKGGKGGLDLAAAVMECLQEESRFSVLYDEKDDVRSKIKKIAGEIYGADDVMFSAQAELSIAAAETAGLAALPICMAKTQYSFSDDMQKLGRPRGFTITVREVRLAAGAGFLVAICGDIMTMPGLPKVPAAEKIDIGDDGKIVGLF